MTDWQPHPWCRGDTEPGNHAQTEKIGPAQWHCALCGDDGTYSLDVTLVISDGYYEGVHWQLASRHDLRAISRDDLYQVPRADYDRWQAAHAAYIACVAEAAALIENRHTVRAEYAAKAERPWPSWPSAPWRKKEA
jgi:hypothetical protein